MQLNQINQNTNYNDFANQVIDFGVMGKYKISQRFNDKDTTPSLLATYKSWGLAGHNGLDLVSCNENNQILSPVDGTVVFADWYTKLDWAEKSIFYGGGIMTFVVDNQNYLHCFLHLSENMNLNKGDKIKAGQSVGTQGGSGEYQNQFANHCHYYLAKVDGQQSVNILDRGNGFFGGVNPLEYIKGQAVKPTEPAPTQDSLKNASFEAIKVLEKDYNKYYDNWGRAFGNTDMASQAKEPFIWVKEMLDQTIWRHNDEIAKLQEQNSGLARQLADSKTDYNQALTDRAKAEELGRQQNTIIKDLEAKIVNLTERKEELKSTVGTQSSKIETLNSVLDDKHKIIVKQGEILNSKPTIFDKVELLKGQLSNGNLPAILISFGSVLTYCIGLLSSPELATLIAGNTRLIGVTAVMIIVMSRIKQILSIILEFFKK